MNQALEFEANLDQQLSLFIGAIPGLIPIFRQLNVVSIINRYCPCQADIDEGTVALILALNRLMSPHPLSYRPKRQKVSEPARYYGVLSDVSISGKNIKQTVKTQALIL